MTLPTFLGIGVARGGSTWLHALLASHPEVYMPTRRKEVRFFDRDYDFGLDWYETFFPPSKLTGQYQAIGEISPQYYRCEACPERIFKTLPKSKLIIILRHPVDRAYSHYGFFVQRRNYVGSFEDFLDSFPRALEHGFYSKFIERYLRYFDRSDILALLFEDAVSDVLTTKKTLANFLDIDVDKFPISAGSKKVNASSVPKTQLLYNFAAKTAGQFRKWHLERVIDYVRWVGIERWLAKGNSLPPLTKEVGKRLSQLYQDEFVDLEKCLQIDLSCWRNKDLESRQYHPVAESRTQANLMQERKREA